MDWDNVIKACLLYPLRKESGGPSKENFPYTGFEDNHESYAWYT